jgi:hypothetical protein
MQSHYTRAEFTKADSLHWQQPMDAVYNMEQPARRHIENDIRSAAELSDKKVKGRMQTITPAFLQLYSFENKELIL